MILLMLSPFAFMLGWFSRFTYIIDSGIIAGLLFVFGFTPLFSTGFSNIEGAPDFHNRDFIGPWSWAFDQLDTLYQVGLLIWFILYFFGKICAYFYIVSKRNK